MKITCKFCRKSFTAPDRWKGQLVECPHCGQATVAKESEGSPKQAVRDEQRPGPRLSPVTQGKDAPRRPALKPSSPTHQDAEEDELRLVPEEAPVRRHVLLEEDLVVEQTKSRKTGAHSASTAHAAGPAKGARGKAPVSPASKTTSHQPLDCPNCGATLPPDGMFCIECGYHMGLKRVLHGELSDLDLDLSVGYVRWFRRQLAEGESGAGVFWLAHALVLIVLSVIGVVGHPNWWIPVGLVAAGYAAFWLWIFKMGGWHFLGKRFWDWRLWWLRRFVWSRLPGYQYIQRHDRQFGDEQLAEIQDLQQVRVLDLEGSGISDRSLFAFQNCERLQAAVVQGTRMTKDGVLRLQIMKPDISIWHDE